MSASSKATGASLVDPAFERETPALFARALATASALFRAKVGYMAQRGREMVPGLGRVDWRAMWKEVDPDSDRLVARSLPDRRVVWPKHLEPVRHRKSARDREQGARRQRQDDDPAALRLGRVRRALAWETKLAQLARAANTFR